MTSLHLPFLAELDSDPEVLRFILGRARSEAEALNYWAPICADLDSDRIGLGWWVGFDRTTDRFLGWWDLSPDVALMEEPTRAQAGWRLARRHWRQGYATEGAAALFDYGFRAVGLHVIWAETMVVNAASRAVMQRLGMREVRTEHRLWEDPLPGAEHGEAVYEIARPAWVSR